jgi:hypothetical protein
MKVMSFNFHNVVKMRIIQKDEGIIISLAKKLGIISIDTEYAAFEVKSIKNPNLTVIIGKFNPNNKECYLLDQKYYVKKDYIYFEDKSVNGAKWETEITGFENQNIVAKINCKNKRAYMVILGYIVEFLINYLMLLKGYSLVHAAGVTKSGQAYIFPARGSAGKTTLTLNLVNKGYEYLGDDYVILHKNNVLSYGTSLHIFNYHLKILNKIFNERLSTSQKINIKLRNLFYLVTNKRLLYRIKIKDLIPSAEVKNDSKIKSLIFLIRKTGIKSPAFRKIPKKDAIKMLISIMKLECNHSTRYYLDAYSIVFPNSKLAGHWDRLREYYDKNLNKQSYSIETPEYSTKVIEEIYKFIEGLK